jgi:hypothetical protein
MFADGYSRDFRAARNLAHDRAGDVPTRTSGDQPFASSLKFPAATRARRTAT